MEKINLSFTLLIAYVVPGSIGAYALHFVSADMNTLLNLGNGGPSVGATLVLAIMALGLGVAFNALSWALIRPTIEWTGVSRPQINYGRLNHQNLPAYQEFVESNYRYYQAYSNSLCAIFIAIIILVVSGGSIPLVGLIAFAALGCLLFAAARDSLKRSYDNIDGLLKGQFHD